MGAYTGTCFITSLTAVAVMKPPMTTTARQLRPVNTPMATITPVVKSTEEFWTELDGMACTSTVTVLALDQH